MNKEAAKWLKVTTPDQVPPREGRSVNLGNYDVALVNTAEGFRAVENRCPHKNGPLADGIVGGETITCPLHNWRICLNSGTVQKPGGNEDVCVRTFPVKVEDGFIYISTEPVPVPAGMRLNATSCDAEVALQDS
jgi:nitrite reductase (NADH) small subunit